MPTHLPRIWRGRSLPGPYPFCSPIPLRNTARVTLGGPFLSEFLTSPVSSRRLLRTLSFALHRYRTAHGGHIATVSRARRLSGRQEKSVGIFIVSESRSLNTSHRTNRGRLQTCENRLTPYPMPSLYFESSHAHSWDTPSSTDSSRGPRDCCSLVASPTG
jgi:hypothetical protein